MSSSSHLMGDRGGDRPRPSLNAIGKALTRRLFAPIDIASLVYFRIAFGAIMLWEVWRYFTKGWIPRYWIDPVINFTYYGFDWVRPLPGIGMYVVFGALGVLAFNILIGWHYRLSAVLFFIGFTYSFLLEQARYLNHFYLICLLSFLLIFLPAHRAFSVDAWRRPAVAAQVAPAWTLALLRAQLCIVYFYAGIAKLNADWFAGEPLRSWLAARTDFPLIGALFTQEWMVYGLSYGGLLLDLGVAPLLLWRRTRWLAYISAVIFHLMHARLFVIGIFPWFMIAATALFFPPSFPREVGRWVQRRLGRTVAVDPRRGRGKLSRVAPIRARRSVILALLAAYLLWQLLFPLRHFLYPSQVNWSYEGHQYSWHMKLLSKRTEAVFAIFHPGSQIPLMADPE
ncbi:MAG TPA: HTTM domain-containing protein, partial [Candidatus Obscuribacterales bacterium]